MTLRGRVEGFEMKNYNAGEELDWENIATSRLWVTVVVSMC
jgi:hypothetical protein